MVEGRNSKKVWERDALWVNEPSESKGPKENSKEITDWPKSKPKGIDGSQESVKVSKGNLEEKEDDDSDRNENGEKNSFWQGDSESLKNYLENQGCVSRQRWRWSYRPMVGLFVLRIGRNPTTLNKTGLVAVTVTPGNIFILRGCRTHHEKLLRVPETWSRFNLGWRLF